MKQTATVLRPLKAFIPYHAVGLVYTTDEESGGAFADDLSDGGSSDFDEPEPESIKGSIKASDLRVVEDDEETLIMGECKDEVLEFSSPSSPSTLGGWKD